MRESAELHQGLQAWEESGFYSKAIKIFKQSLMAFDKIKSNLEALKQ